MNDDTISLIHRGVLIAGKVDRNPGRPHKHMPQSFAFVRASKIPHPATVGGYAST
jgi:hypothetical protein